MLLDPRVWQPFVSLCLSGFHYKSNITLDAKRNRRMIREGESKEIQAIKATLFSIFICARNNN